MLSIIICIILVILTFVITYMQKKDKESFYAAWQYSFVAAFLSIICWIILDFTIGTIAPTEYKYTEKIYYENIIVSSDKIIYTDTENYINELSRGNLDSIQLQEDTETYIEVKHYEHNPSWLAITGNYQEYIVHGNAELQEGQRWEMHKMGNKK